MNAILEIQLLRATSWREGFHAAARNEPLNLAKPRAWQDGWYAYGTHGTPADKSQEAAQAVLRG